MKQKVNPNSHARSMDALAEMMRNVENADVFADDFIPEVWLDLREECIEFAMAVSTQFNIPVAQVLDEAQYYGG